MSVYSGPKISNDGLVLALDAANINGLVKSAEVLVVGGGGAGGGGIGGGGGGGGVIWMPAVSIISGNSYSIVVGTGGTPVVYPGISGSGNTSTAFGATAAGGGGSGTHDSGDGVAGGSGGGAASNNGRINQGGASSGNSLGSNSGFIYGNPGGHMLASRIGTPTAAAGGGGAGSAAANTNSNTVQTSPGNTNGRGGNGIPNSILGTTYYWGGGGGGGAYYNGYAGDGGLGGGGGGSCSAGSGSTSGGGSALNSGTGAAINTNGGAGGNNTGGGGGGGSWQVTSGGAGGSGIVIIKYLGPQKATGGTITSVNGYTIHTFTTSGTFDTSMWLDVSGLGNNGTITNNPTYSSSNGGILTFDGSNDYIELLSPSNKWAWTPSGAGNNTLSLEMFVKSTDTGGRFFCKPWNGSGEYNYWLTTDGWYSRVGAQDHNQTFSSLATGNWEHIVCIITPTQKAVYRNGQINAAFTNHNITNNTPSSGNGNIPLAIMTLYPYGIGTWDYPNFSESGDVSNFKIYNRALSATEVLNNFNAYRGRFNL